MTPKTLGLVTIAAAMIAAVPAAQQQAPPPAQTPPVSDEPQQRPIFRGGARFVRVDVYPADPKGVPVEGLTAQDFEVYEDGKLQAIDTFEFVRVEPEVEEARVDPNSQREGEEWAKDPRARVFVVMLDKWHVEILGGASIRRPLTDMLERLIGPRDVFGVTTPQMRPTDLMLGRKTLTISDELQRYWTWGALAQMSERDAHLEYFEDCFGPSRGNPMLQELLARARERDTLQHLEGLVAKLGALRDEKKAVVVVTQGWRQFGRNEEAVRKLPTNHLPGIYSGGGRMTTRPPQTSGPGGTVDMAACYMKATELLMMDNRRFFIDLLPKAQRANVSFYPVDPRGLAVFDTPLSQGGPSNVISDFAALRSRRDGLMELAENTDGMALLNSNDLTGTLRKLADSLSVYYLLGYYSDNTKFDGGYRRIQVKVRKPDIKLKARRGYFAPTQAEIDSIAAGREAAARPVPAETMALTTALGRLDELRHDRDLFLQAARVPGGVVVSAELGVNARSNAAWAKGGEVRVAVSAGGQQVTETLKIEPLRAGAFARIPLSTGADGAEIRIDARARSGAGGGAADATMTLEAAEAGLLGAPLSYRGIARALQPAADGRYRRTERATVEAPVAAGAVPAGARVLDRLGKPLNVPATARERIDPSGARWVAAEVSLAPLTEGDYVIEVEAMKDERKEKVLFAIRVVR